MTTLLRFVPPTTVAILAIVLLLDSASRWLVKTIEAAQE